jgi:hypothetical protein
MTGKYQHKQLCGRLRYVAVLATSVAGTCATVHAGNGALKVASSGTVGNAPADVRSSC